MSTTRQPGRKELSHERIVETAARAIRRAGFAGVGVADIMKEAGLTHGGFYAHFPSRDALLVEAIERAGLDSATNALSSAQDARLQGISAFHKLVTGYLSERHLKGTETGCAVAALASEMPRQSTEVRKAAAQSVRRMLDAVQQRIAARRRTRSGLSDRLPDGWRLAAGARPWRQRRRQGATGRRAPAAARPIRHPSALSHVHLASHGIYIRIDI